MIDTAQRAAFCGKAESTLRQPPGTCLTLSRWFSPAPLAFWRQIEPDKLVAAFPCRIHCGHKYFRMLLEDTDAVRAEHDKSQFAAFRFC